jgi:hypothetical protein
MEDNLRGGSHPRRPQLEGNLGGGGYGHTLTETPYSRGTVRAVRSRLGAMHSKMSAPLYLVALTIVTAGTFSPNNQYTSNQWQAILRKGIKSQANWDSLVPPTSNRSVTASSTGHYSDSGTDVRMEIASSRSHDRSPNRDRECKRSTIAD